MIELFYHGLVLGLLLLTLGNLVANLLAIRSLGNAPSVRRYPRVSVLVPARNEAHRIRPCAQSLQMQDYPEFEVIVLNDNSEDDTESVLRELGYGEGKFRLISGAPLPPGWTGKAWACHQLAQAAQGEYFLFTDADTVHSPETLRATMAQAEASRADLLTVFPRQITGSWSEKLVIPLLFLLGVGIYPFALFQKLQDRPSLVARLPLRLLRGLGGANGQFLLFKSSSYLRIGGHEKVRSHLVEDVALGREISARMGEGMRLVTCDATDFVACRMYESFGDLWEGFTKNLRAVFEDALGLFLLTGVVQFGVFLLPFLLLAIPGMNTRVLLLEVSFIYLLRGVLSIRFKTSWLGSLLHPFGFLLAFAIGLNSWRKSAGAGVSWKGRVYQVD